MKATIYPNLPFRGKGNPYIKDFTSALHDSGIQVANPPHKNPLFSICFKKINSDFYFFHWIEDIGNHKFGYLQAFMAIVFLLRIKLHKRTIIWFLHNREGHTTLHKRTRKILVNVLTRYSDYIITHATEGVEVIDSRYRKKVVFMDHPAKNRMRNEDSPKHSSTSFDLLIWGSISRYKGVLEFLRFAQQTNSTLKIRIAGNCEDKQLLRELEKAKTDYTCLENKSVSFEELNSYIQEAKFVLIPYLKDSVLSSGVLMDSLSFGAKVIGPNAGSFKDYASSSEINVFTFDNYADIEYIVSANTSPISINGYNDFLRRNSWDEFMKRLLQ